MLDNETKHLMDRFSMAIDLLKLSIEQTDDSELRKHAVKHLINMQNHFKQMRERYPEYDALN
jgi:hypothetical protein